MTSHAEEFVVVNIRQKRKAYGPHHYARCVGWLESFLYSYEMRYGVLSATSKAREYRILTAASFAAMDGFS